MKQKKPFIQPSCALCIHASLSPTEDTQKIPPLLLSLSHNVMNEGAGRILCPYKKTVSPSFSCRRFSFDPLKYRPKKAPVLGTLDEDSLLLD
ncbi:MAG: hypothetical protein E7609_00800 [Ruminococcaceae bacterium]|nr:hypothetical protein [Oscillospiraceae bacterium]